MGAALHIWYSIVPPQRSSSAPPQSSIFLRYLFSLVFSKTYLKHSLFWAGNRTCEFTSLFLTALIINIMSCFTINNCCRWFVGRHKNMKNISFINSKIKINSNRSWFCHINRKWKILISSFLIPFLPKNLTPMCKIFTFFPTNGKP